MMLLAKMLKEFDVKIIRTVNLSLANNRVIERLREINIEIEKHKTSITLIVFGEEKCLSFRDHYGAS